MAKFAITIGVNKYYDENIRDLKYAASDAEKVRDFLIQEENFDEVFCYTDNSPLDKLPEYKKLRRFFARTEHYLLTGDDLWFFFAGHGRRGDDQIDYLLVSDSDVEDIEGSSLSVNYVIQRLQLIGADKIIVIIDACRDNEDSCIGEKTQQQIRKMGQISIFSCSRYEYSREEPKIQQGVFTHTLLKAFRRGQVTPKKLDEYLPSEIAKLSKQTPIVNFSSISQSNLILTSKYANQDDIENLRRDAFTASKKEKWYDANLLFKNLKNVKNVKKDVELDRE
ncbi:caspase family protein [Dapis sp. BLCC M229]|uniref:caspase family protein n=1 Tax=Dapis sp. BLCC M229 TaxID=3400188 RepID=UPI003CF87988